MQAKTKKGECYKLDIFPVAQRASQSGGQRHVDALNFTLLMLGANPQHSNSVCATIAAERIYGKHHQTLLSKHIKSHLKLRPHDRHH